MRKWNCLLLVVLMISFSCKDETRPKPKGFLSLEYPDPEYSRVDLPCSYDFEMNSLAEVKPSRNNVPCWINLEYPSMNGVVFITYQPVKNNLDSLLRDAQKLPLRHTIKADVIQGDKYVNPQNRTYGMFYEVAGDAASQAQFYLTDSTRHFLTGSLYFNRQPNFDSIYPSAEYLKKDMKHLMETLKWNY